MKRLAFCLALVAAPAVAAEGKAGGYRPAPLSITNGTDAPMACRAVLAHWYLNEYGPAAPGAAVNIPLRYDSASGTVSILNSVGDEMAVERLVCGAAGAVWDSAGDVAYKALAGAGSETLSCEKKAGGFSCR
ncbi:hypothetical protein [Pseudooceanicola nanhaiensis]|uniref:hypothetical protein n=1 Tax=Pseudooceanicola nanhaiensis TaxID=375761 RepID=UPI001CD6ECFF|nr:hypothetical protein [Pseudooceanicola nanhaiensis]MCA0921284.1 hypothetical protein [Pseudooceanicola nanhaiensis]